MRRKKGSAQSSRSGGRDFGAGGSIRVKIHGVTTPEAWQEKKCWTLSTHKQSINLTPPLLLSFLYLHLGWTVSSGQATDCAANSNQSYSLVNTYCVPGHCSSNSLHPDCKATTGPILPMMKLKPRELRSFGQSHGHNQDLKQSISGIRVQIIL